MKVNSAEVYIGTIELFYTQILPQKNVIEGKSQCRFYLESPERIKRFALNPKAALRKHNP